ncbi:MAG: lysophospholipid acyltransferase family protein [bacterium]
MKGKSNPLLYRIIRAGVRMAMAVFFQKIELRHGEYVPEQGPVVFVANHPNSIMDALVMGAVTRRKVNYIGHAGLFSSRFKSWFLKSCGVIPVYRREDAPDKMDQNIFAFQACYQALERGETVGIFPEGTSDMLRKVKKLKTGAARIALEAERRNQFRLQLQCIPIGLYFFSRSRFRSKVLVNVGQPIDLQPFFALYQKDNYAAVQKLTAEIQKSLERLTVNVRDEELDQFVRDLEIIYREELKSTVPELVAPKQSTVADFILTKRIAECVEHYYRCEPERVLQLQERIALYKRKLNKLHLKDAMLKEKLSFGQLLRMSVQSFGQAFLGLPLAVYGIVNSFLPYCLAEYFARKFVDERTKILSALFIGGGMAFLLFYAVQIFLVWYFLGILWSTVYGLSLPLTGFFALTYLKGIRAEQERLNFSFFLFTNRQLFNKMRRERKKLIAELDAIKEEYLHTMGLAT